LFQQPFALSKTGVCENCYRLGREDGKEENMAVLKLGKLQQQSSSAATAAELLKQQQQQQ